MAGIYIHIPFCRQACRYCDFFFTVSLRYREEYVDSLIHEIGQNTIHNNNDGDGLNTLYFGGGTPSVLLPAQLDRILDALRKKYAITPDAELSIECNPDDLDQAYLTFLLSRGFNRISIGIQSFFERDLSLMRRSHNAGQAKSCVWEAATAGFKNITIDLIYGIPGQSTSQWEENLKEALALPLSHLSAYHLTFEPGTVFYHWRKKKRIVPVHEKDSEEQYRILRAQMLGAAYDHYEISNFAKDGLMSKHNLLYWSGSPYLGLGPSAHSFDGKDRHWNLSSLKEYMEKLRQNGSARETEKLSIEEQYHDYLITSLRTRWGADPKIIRERYGEKFLKYFNLKTGPFLEKGSMWQTEGHLAIHPDHWLITDHILRELFME